MKKIYRTPAIMVVKIQTANIMTGSIQSTSEGGPGVGEEYSEGSYNANSRGGGSFWDED